MSYWLEFRDRLYLTYSVFQPLSNNPEAFSEESGASYQNLSIYWPAGLGINAETGRYGLGQKFLSLFFFLLPGGDACPGTSVAKTVSLWPEDVSEPALGSPRMEGQQVLPGSLAREDRAPTCSMTSPTTHSILGSSERVSRTPPSSWAWRARACYME